MSARSNFEASAVSKLSANKAEAASVIIRTIVCTCNPKKNSKRIMKTWLDVAGTKVAYLSHPLGSVFLCKALVQRDFKANPKTKGGQTTANNNIEQGDDATTNGLHA